MDFSPYAPEAQSLIQASPDAPPIMATKQGDGGWTIPSELPPLGMPEVPGLPPWPGGSSPSPGDPDYVPPGGVEPELPPLPGGGGGGLPEVPGLYTEADLERAREEGRREEAAKQLKHTMMAAVVTGLVGYGLARVLP